MAIMESLEMRKHLCCGWMERELRISRKEGTGVAEDT